MDNALIDRGILASVALTGNYDDLKNKPYLLQKTDIIKIYNFAKSSNILLQNLGLENIYINNISEILLDNNLNLKETLDLLTENYKKGFINKIITNHCTFDVSYMEERDNFVSFYLSSMWGNNLYTLEKSLTPEEILNTVKLRRVDIMMFYDKQNDRLFLKGWIIG